MPLTYQDFVDDAAKIGCSVAAVRTVAQVESAGGGFCPDGFPKILFEGHLFHKYTKGKFTPTHPDLSYAKWTRQFYGKTWEKERERFNRAIALDRNAALLSTSFGMFQILGANFAACGCKTVQEFVNKMCKDENTQLALFTEYILFNGLADELRDGRWADFARLYNGPSYTVNKYDVKMAQAFAKLKLEDQTNVA